jgi:molybdenum cofactor cytidylyltransferase
VGDAPKRAAAEPVAVLILAAGGSSRMGEAKQLLEIGGETLVRRAARSALASRARPVAVVLGAAAERLRRELADLPVDIVVNRAWRRGLSSSIGAGLAHLESRAEPVRAALITLCDQPLVTGALLDRLLDAYADSQAPIVASAYAGTAGVPALFDRALFEELHALRGDGGARSLVERYSERAIRVPFPDGAVDVDTPEDYAALRRRSE